MHPYTYMYLVPIPSFTIYMYMSQSSGTRKGIWSKAQILK